MQLTTETSVHLHSELRTGYVNLLSFPFKMSHLTDGTTPHNHVEGNFHVQHCETDEKHPRSIVHKIERCK